MLEVAEIEKRASLPRRIEATEIEINVSEVK
jgi:hypothetical protein